MELFRLSRRSCIFLVLFLIVNPLPGLLARGEAKPRPGNEGNYRWQNRGCKAVFNAIYNNVKIQQGDLLFAASNINVKVNPGDKELQEVFSRIEKFVRANPDKLSGAASITALLASACLLYDSILLTREIGRFFNRIDELRDQFDTFLKPKLPKIEKLLIEVREKIETGSVPDDRELRRIESVLLLYFKEIIDLLDKVRDLIQEAIVAKWDAQFTAAVSFIFAVATGVAASPMVPISSPFFNVGMIAASCLGTTAGVLSLKNADDCKLALEEMQGLKKKMEGLKSQVWDWMLEMKMN